MSEAQRRAAVLGASEEGGTGWCIAETLAAQGCHVTVGARRIEGLTKLAAQISGTPARCDATVENEVEAFVATAAGEGQLDCAVLVAGAGIRGTIDTMRPEDFEHCMKLNFHSAVHFLRHTARRMKEDGAIVLMSSIAATNPWKGYFAYGAAKAALQTLVKYAAIEFADRRIRVNAVCPGPISTPAARYLVDHPRAGAVVAHEVPLGRVAGPQDVADAVAWLCTAPGWITGETIHTDGGMSLRRPPDIDAIAAAFAAQD
ncbi:MULTISPECIES: SDR family oxidoreductase [Novosphingobium]|uniref:SDR family oxidoreductase n=1 Tax=Novosphingobium TaxID=165696 RepID=UPI0022F2485F|nr:SDR family oxidoreductase [Novosphingobium resinovorum]GLK42793.1 oxidoreductase [Novosphingobium resinovorum]